MDAKLVKAFGHPDPDTGLRNAKHLAAQLDKNYPGAAASLRIIESMISLPRTPATSNAGATGRCAALTAAGMLNAKRSFRRIKGYKRMPQLVDALHRHTHPETTHDAETVGAAA